MIKYDNCIESLSEILCESLLLTVFRTCNDTINGDISICMRSKIDFKTVIVIIYEKNLNYFSIRFWENHSLVYRPIIKCDIFDRYNINDISDYIMSLGPIKQLKLITDRHIKINKLKNILYEV